MLSRLRQEIKDAGRKAQLLQEWEDCGQDLAKLLDSDDAKTRKNAALLLGELGCRNEAKELFAAYEKEETRFVRSAYLQALFHLDASAYVPKLKERIAVLSEQPVEEENRKHVEEELRALHKLVIHYEGIRRHTFQVADGTLEVLLLTNRLQREFIYRRIPVGRARPHPLGILVETDRFWELSKFRLYRDLVFPVHLAQGKLLPPQPREAAAALWESDFYELLAGLHTEGGEFYFRVECKSPMTLEDRSDFSKKLSAELERLSGGKLINSTSDYEVELRLSANREGKFFPCIKLYTFEDKRFSYRKNAIASSIHPSVAALTMELAEPYLKQEAQIIDPFCGVGTMLVERAKKGSVHDVYGIDIFGEAIRLAKENTQLAGMDINFINRDFLDFTHGYKFDEIISNMPVRGKKTRDEMDRLYAGFFRKAGEILAEDGIMVLYSNEPGLLKKQLRLHREYQLLEEAKLQSKGEYGLFVIGMR